MPKARLLPANSNANSNCSIELSSGSTPRLDVKRGIRQGCPISPYFFLLVTQLLAIHINSSNLKGITVAEREIIVSQLADDTTIFLKDSTQIPCALNIINVFSRASGLYLNVNKCELMAVKDSASHSISNIPVKDTVTYLGISIVKDQKTRSSLNFTPIIEKTRKRFNLWLLRDLSLRGRTLISKAEGISRLTYAALSLHIDNKTIKCKDQMLFNFLWKNKTHYIKKNLLL